MVKQQQPQGCFTASFMTFIMPVGVSNLGSWAFLDPMLVEFPEILLPQIAPAIPRASQVETLYDFWHEKNHGQTGSSGSYLHMFPHEKINGGLTSVPLLG